jgi:hypothetical protein
MQGFEKLPLSAQATYFSMNHIDIIQRSQA